MLATSQAHASPTRERHPRRQRQRRRRRNALCGVVADPAQRRSGAAVQWRGSGSAVDGMRQRGSALLADMGSALVPRAARVARSALRVASHGVARVLTGAWFPTDAVGGALLLVRYATAAKCVRPRRHQWTGAKGPMGTRPATQAAALHGDWRAWAMPRCAPQSPSTPTAVLVPTRTTPQQHQRQRRCNKRVQQARGP